MKLAMPETRIVSVRCSPLRTSVKSRLLAWALVASTNVAVWLVSDGT